jgi:hypothetical protein
MAYGYRDGTRAHRQELTSTGGAARAGAPYRAPRPGRNRATMTTKSPASQEQKTTPDGGLLPDRPSSDEMPEPPHPGVRPTPPAPEMPVPPNPGEMPVPPDPGAAPEA